MGKSTLCSEGVGAIIHTLAFCWWSVLKAQ